MYQKTDQIKYNNNKKIIEVILIQKIYSQIIKVVKIDYNNHYHLISNKEIKIKIFRNNNLKYLLKKEFYSNDFIF
jgi:hypothetical protein